MSEISFEAFARVDLRIGTILSVEEAPPGAKAAYRLRIDFGKHLGIKRSSAQITRLYTPAELIGRQVLAVVNLPAKRVAGYPSEVLVTGVVCDQGSVVLVQPERPVANGARLA